MKQQQTSKVLNIRIPSELHNQLVELAEIDRRSITQLVIIMLEEAAKERYEAQA